MAYNKPRKIKIYDFEGKPESATWSSDKVTGKEIKDKFKVPSNKMVVMKGAKGSTILQDNKEYDLSKSGVTLSVQPNIIQGGFFSSTASRNQNIDLNGFDYRKNQKARYIISQLLDYGEEKYRREKLTVQITRDLKYICIPEFPLPAIWRQRRVSILIHIPHSYPDAPPQGFYVPCGTCLKNGQQHGHQFCSSFYQQPNLHSQGWDWFCIHVENKTDWLPKDDPLRPHNFWNIIEWIRLGLSHYELRRLQL